MKRKSMGVIVAGVLMCLSGGVVAQECVVTTYLGRMLGSHPSIRAKELNLQSADGLVTSAWMQFLPTPSISVDKGPSNTAANGGGDRAAIYRISQPIWAGGRLTAGLDASRLRREQAQLDIQDTVQALSLKFISLYQSWWSLDAKLRIQKRDLLRLESLRDMMVRRVASGVSAEIDLDLAGVRVVQQQSDVAQTERALASVLGQIRAMFGEEVQLEPVALADVPKVNLSYESLMARVVDVSPVLRKAQVAERLARVEVDQIKADASPSLTVRAERQDGSYSGSLSSGHRVYASMQFSLGAAGSVMPQIAAASSRAVAASQDVDAVRRDVAGQIKSDWEDYHSVVERLPRLQRATQSASAVVDSSLRLFTGGRRSWLDLINSVREHSQSELYLIEARASLVGSGFKIQLLTGQLAQHASVAR
jgi:outer membrane protein, adhesin transport system